MEDFSWVSQGLPEPPPELPPDTQPEPEDFSWVASGEPPPIIEESPAIIPEEVFSPSPMPPQDLIRDFVPAVKYGENTLQLNKAISDLGQPQYVEENPLEAGLETLFTVLSGGLPRRPKTDEELAALEQEVEERSKVQQAQRIMGTKDVEEVGDALDLVVSNIGSSLPAMGRSIVSGGTMTPHILGNEIYASLADIKDLSSKDRMALSRGGGLIAGLLENLGLKFMIKGIPKEALAKMGVNKLANLIDKSAIAKVGTQGGVASLTEAITEGGQEAVGVGAELIAGKEFQKGEIAERIKEAFKLGGITGGTLATGGRATVEGVKKYDQAKLGKEGAPKKPPVEEKVEEEKVEKKDAPESQAKTEVSTPPPITKVGSPTETQETVEEDVTEQVETEVKPPTEKPPKLTGKSFEGEEGREDHLTRKETGTVDPTSISHIEGKRGEKRGKHRNKKGKEWKDFKADIKKNGVKETILITKDFNEDPVVVEGNHRLDAALELGLKSIPVEINYFGKAEDQGLASQVKEEVKVEEKKDVETKPEEKVEDVKEEVETETKEVEEVKEEVKTKPKKKTLKEKAEIARLKIEEAKKTKEVEVKEKEVDMWANDTRMPVRSLYGKRYGDRIEYLEEEYPEGMNYYDYREDLQEIKQEQLDERGSEDDIDWYSDQLDNRAVNNFKKAIKKQTPVEGKGKKKKDPVETKEDVEQAELIRQQEEEVDQAGIESDLEDTIPDLSEGDTPTGININDDTQPFTDEILRGEKTIETRDSDTLRSKVGKRIGIIKTGKNKKAMLVGYATVGEPKVYNTKEDFRADESKHRIAEGSDFDFKEGKKKYGYPLTDIEKIDPEPVDSKGIVSRAIKGISTDEVKAEIEKGFGKETIRKLTKNDGVTIFATQKELEAEIETSPSMEGRKIAGAFDPTTGKAYLVAENISKDKAPGVLLHEVGEHAALNDMLGDVQYEALSKSFDALVKAKDPIALAAQKRVPKQTLHSRRRSENLAYLVQEVQNQLSSGKKVSSKARTLYNRVINLIRKWLTKLPSYRKFEGRAALKRLRKGELLTPENIASLARVAVDYHTATDKKGFKKGVIKFSEEGTRVTTTEEAEAWKADNKRPERKKARIDSPELQQAAKNLEAGEITFDEYQKLVDKIAPIKKFDEVPEPATNLEVAGAIDKGKLKDGKLLNEDGVIEDNAIVENRLDIPAYEDFDVWVATITPEEGGKIYGGTAKLKNVTFKTQPSGALKIAQEKGKYPLATMKGEWVNSTNEDLKTEADDLMNDPNWVQIGMNPERQSSFYAKEDKTINGEVIKKGTPLTSAEEVIQVGGFVLAKNPSIKDVPKFTSKKTGKEIQFSEAEKNEFAEVEARFEKAKVKAKKKKPFDAVKEVAERGKNIFTRSHADLDPKKFGQTLEYLRQVQNVAPYAQWQTFQDIYSFVDQMSDDELEIFTYNIILPDMVKDLDSGLLSKKDGELPFGYKSKAQVKRHLKLMQEKAEGKVAKAVEKRNEVMNKLKEELIDEGLLSEELRKDDAYYHHQVLQFMELEDQFKGDFNVNSQKAGVRTKKQGWQKARTGSTKDYNTQYLDAEFAVMSMMRSQLETKRLLNKIKKQEDKSKQIKAQAKEEGVEVEDMLRNSEEWQDYTIWKPNPDSVWYHTYTLNDKVAQEVLAEVEATEQRIAENKKAQKEGKPLPKRKGELDKPWIERKKGVEVTPADMGEAIVKGKDETWIIPKELAKTLNEGKKQNEGIAKVSAWTLQAWKKWVLLNPERWIKYNLNNTSGDIDIAFAFDPVILLKYSKKAAKDLYDDHKKKKLSPELQQELGKWRKKGVIDSGFAITEVDDFSKMYDKLFNARPSNMKDETWAEATGEALKDIGTAPVKAAKGYWKNAKEYTTLRENILRLASVRYFEERIAKNPNEKIYAASKSYEIDQIKDNDDRASKLARELIGDYGNISHAGQFIREHVMPFWSWTEINAPRYIRLLANSAKEDGGSTKQTLKRIAKTIPGKTARTATSTTIYGGVKLAQFAALSGLITLWNHTFFPEEEEKMSEFERNQLHITLGDIFNTGEVVSLRASGAFADALSWLSVHDSFNDYQKGKTVGEIFENMWKAPIQKLVAGLTPLPKLFYETIAGQAFWPDVFNPRPIRDRWQHIAKAFSAGKIYDWAFDKPSRGWGKNLAKLVLTSTDPGETAYYKTRGLVRDYNAKEGDVASGGFKPTDKNNALYYYKQALKYSDFEAAEKYLNDYIRLAGGRKKAAKGLKTSIKRSAPMGGVKNRDLKKFINSLSESEKQTVRTAREWYKKTYKH